MATVETYGATPFRPIGRLDWQSPYREIDAGKHADAVAKAERWLGENAPWLIALARLGGLPLFTDGVVIALSLPSLEGPPRMITHLISVIDVSVQPVPPTSAGSLQ